MKTRSGSFIVGSLCFVMFLCGAFTSVVLNAQNESSVALPSFSYQTFSFQKDLKLGDSNQDIRQLQIVLNTDQETRVAFAGVGSKGQESTYFGQLTANAVRRFQIKYKEVPSGTVDLTARKKLNQIISSIIPNAISTVTATTSASSTSLVSGPQLLTKEALPRLYTVQPRQIKKGDSFTLVGAGFESKNTIHIGTGVFSNVLPADSNNISFMIPTTSVVQNGTYEVWVENSSGTSRVSGQPINLTISDSSYAVPTISSVLPTTVSGSGTVTVTGTGFGPSGNDIISGFGTLKNISSNGTQISFSPRSLLSAEVISRIPVGRNIKVDFYVVNANGTSNIFGSVNVKL